MNWLIKLSVISILVFSSIFKLIYLEYFEFSLVEKEMSNWYYSSITIHSVIIIEFVLATSILLKSINIKLVSICIFLLSLLYGADAIACNNEGMFSNYFILPFYSKWIVITCSFILIFFSFWLSRIKSEKNRNKRIRSIITNLCLVLIISVPLFIINPIYIDDFQKNNSTVENPTLTWENVYNKCEESKINIDSKAEVFFAFLSTSCYYCNSAAVRLGVSKRARLNSTQIVLVFPGNIKDTEAFIQRNRCEFPYIRISKDEFRKIAGNEFPAFFRVKDRKETNYYTGRTLNLRELDNLFQLN
jgi:hypothetical protein